MNANHCWRMGWITNGDDSIKGNEQTDETKSVALEMLPAGSNFVRLRDEGKGGYDKL